MTELIEAIKKGDIDTAIKLIAECVNLDIKSNHGWTALHYACRFNQKQIVTMLLEKGINVNAQNKYDNTALHTACWYGHNEIVTLLEKYGAKK
jgi:ankyrin repeat protein